MRYFLTLSYTFLYKSLLLDTKKARGVLRYKSYIVMCRPIRWLRSLR